MIGCVGSIFVAPPLAPCNHIPNQMVMVDHSMHQQPLHLELPGALVGYACCLTSSNSSRYKIIWDWSPGKSEKLGAIFLISFFHLTVYINTGPVLIPFGYFLFHQRPLSARPDLLKTSHTNPGGQPTGHMILEAFPVF